ncbi:MAG: hypothetical protein F6K09_29535 [Merismopedia sp. SIO2A8]|nr:hypothetical protein [Symploca sp. SIO2B6]NET52671.1 hypothetical protein [Merismopedia sp. SIO2A8]
MAKLAPVTLDNGAVIYVEIAEDAIAPDVPIQEDFGEESREEKGVVEDVQRSFQAMKGTIQSYTQYTLDAFRGVAAANVEKVTLEFGIKIAGEMGVPYVTKGTAESNLKITVECSFPEESSEGE